MNNAPPERPTRVLRIITRLNIGGPSIHAARLSAALTGAGFETRLVHGRVGTDEGDMRYLVADDACDVQFLPSLRRPIAPLSDVRALFALYRLMSAFRPQIVHTHMAKAGMLGRTVAFFYNLTHPQSRAIVLHTYHGHVLDGYFSPLVTSVFINLERLLARATDMLIGVSLRIRDDLLDRYRIGRRDRFAVVALGLDLDALGAIDDAQRDQARRELRVDPGAPVVTTVGRLTAIKHHDLFLDVASLVVARMPAALFMIAGDGELRGRLEAAAAARGLTSHVRFLGWRRDLATIYGATDVFLLTSKNEGTPVALIEAMAAGVPGVSTDVGGVRDVIVDEACGIVRPANDAAALADGVIQLLSDPPRRKDMGVAARQVALTRFRFARLASDIAELYRRLLNR